MSVKNPSNIVRWLILLFLTLGFLIIELPCLASDLDLPQKTYMMIERFGLLEAVLLLYIFHLETIKRVLQVIEGFD
jgi:hypothetical protein